ncbi:uncharacterized protein RJT21DRAFT_119836 [Scheffersomyces amazonensis]|uniref:uncharacterized protein n=1 Tax=Scheffersomyces amazonensis TaxID=1078765 RepID=UPI00315C922B
MTIETSLKIVTPVGMLGYGYDENELFQAINRGASAIIIDSGSTDSGPQKLGLGKMTCPPDSYIRDLQPLADAAFHRKVKVIISSAGGDGSNEHVDTFVSMIKDYAKQKKYNLNIVKIYAEIPKSDIHQALDDGLIEPCGKGPSELTHDEVIASTRVVAQMGMEPFVEAMKLYPDYDIIIAGRAYDPSPYAAYCYFNGYTNMGVIYNMGKVMECGGLCLTPKSKTAFAEIWQDKFEISSMATNVVCTAESLAAHTLYEKSRPDLLPGPGGVLDLREAEFISKEKSAVAKGAKFIKSDEYTIKLEGAKVAGYKTLFVGSINDPILTSNISEFIVAVKLYLKSVFKGKEYELKIDIYKGNSSISTYVDVPQIGGGSVFLLGEVLSSNQELSNSIASMARIAVVHGPYPGQKATAGNLAMPVIPLEIPLGVHCEFNIYHLMKVQDSLKYFRSEKEILLFGEDPSTTRLKNYQPEIPESDSSMSALQKASKDIKNRPFNFPSELNKPKDNNYVFLHSLAKVIRSKNAGPFEITFDVIFPDVETFEWVKQSQALSLEKMSKLYNIEENDVIAHLFFRQSLSFKFTIPRKHSSASFYDNDLHGSQQHVPLMFVQVLQK